jgi:GT2 family glycosyltransferase
MTVAAIAIGRNEGDRLRRSLASLASEGIPMIYVDSGSTDDSLAIARAAGATIVELDTSVPFTAARARNAGFKALPHPRPAHVQFLDGDCTIVPGWLSAATTFLDTHPDYALVTGWRSETAPDTSLYNAICDHEWHRPAGDIATCGGDMLVRSTAFAAIGGFNPAIIAAEDDDFCLRLARAGHCLHRLPLPMTRHDAAITRLAQFWNRATRAGHAFAEIGRLHPPHFRTEQVRSLLYGALLPLAALVGLLTTIWLTATAIALLALSTYRTARGLSRDGIAPSNAARMALLFTLTKPANAFGMARYHLRRLRGQTPTLIEYK